MQTTAGQCVLVLNVGGCFGRSRVKRSGYSVRCTLPGSLMQDYAAWRLRSPGVPAPGCAGSGWLRWQTQHRKRWLTLWVPKTPSVCCDLHLASPAESPKTGHARIIRCAPSTVLEGSANRQQTSATTSDAVPGHDHPMAVWRPLTQDCH